MDIYQFAYSIYQRPFRQPLTTSHGQWMVREGIIVRLTDASGRSGYGEIAPIEWFGSESLDRAIEWCDAIGDNIASSQIEHIPNDLPACQFGCGSALLALTAPSTIEFNESELNFSALLPAGADAIAKLPELLAGGYSTFKWKIGVLPIETEIGIWQQLIAALPPHTKLRLDANGGLDLTAATRWLETIATEPRLEFIEQPLPPEQLDLTIELSHKYSTPIALDESISTCDRLQTVYDRGWRGIYVIKPGIAGFPWRLAELITTYQLDVAFSSVMETSVGRTAALQLAAKLQLDRALGFGVDEWFGEN